MEEVGASVFSVNRKIPTDFSLLAITVDISDRQLIITPQTKCKVGKKLNT